MTRRINIQRGPSAPFPEVLVWDIAEAFGQAVAELRVAAEKRGAETP
jgi:hypothetical protein